MPFSSVSIFVQRHCFYPSKLILLRSIWSKLYEFYGAALFMQLVSTSIWLSSLKIKIDMKSKHKATSQLLLCHFPNLESLMGLQLIGEVCKSYWIIVASFNCAAVAMRVFPFQANALFCTSINLMSCTCYKKAIYCKTLCCVWVFFPIIIV